MEHKLNPPPSQSTQNVRALIAQLTSPNASDRTAAIIAFQQMKAECLGVVDALLRPSQKRSATKKCLTGLASVLVGAVAAWYVGMSSVALLLVFPVSSVATFILSWVFLDAVSCLLAQQQSKSKCLPIVVQSLVQREDVFGVLGLLEVIYVDKDLSYDELLLGEQREAIRHAVIRLLPSLAAELAEVMPPKHRKQLLDILKHYTRFVFQGHGADGPAGYPFTDMDVPVSLAILNVVASLGDADTFHYIGKLATEKGRTAEAEKVMEAARAGLLLLQTRVAQQQNHQSLLRASHESPRNEDSLLRPATEERMSRTQQFLRPTLPED